MSKKLSKKYIESNIFTISDIDTNEDFVAMTVELDENLVCKHSGIIICFEGELQYFHYDSEKVELTKEIPPEKFYFKKTDVIEDQIIGSFLWHCEKLASEVSPIYGWHFDESYYDSNSEYYLKNAKTDITTCVGFCIKVLTGFFDNRYLELTDWDVSSLNSLDNIEDGLVERYKNYLHRISVTHDIDSKELFDKDKMKRILPSEMFSTAFYKDLPIKKEDTDAILFWVENYFKTIAA